MDFNGQDLGKMAQMVQKVKGKSEEETIQRLAELIRSGEAGITTQKALQMIKTLSPMLNASQRRTLDKLAKKLQE